MSYCGKCGKKNPDGAKFCYACGAPLMAEPVSEPVSEPVKNPLPPSQREEQPVSHEDSVPRHEDNIPRHENGIPPKWERIQLHREGAPSREGTPPQSKRTAGAWREIGDRKAKGGGEPPKNTNKPQQTKDKGNGCLKRLLWWTAGIIVLLIVLIWAFSKCSGGDGDNGDEKDTQDPTKFERIMSQESTDSLQEAIGFPKTTNDVAPLAGDYEVMAQSFPVSVTLQPAQDGKVVGKAQVKLAGHTKVKGVYVYCGNSIYGIYEDEEDIGGKARNYFYALEDRKSIMMIDGGEYILKRKEVKLGKKASEGLLSKDYERSFDDERFEQLRERHKFPHSTVDVSIENGTYEAVKEDKGTKVFLTLEIESVNSDNKKIIGRATLGGKVEGQEDRRQDLVLTYAGYSTYAVYEKEEDIGDLDAMALFASPDGKTLDVYDHGEIFFSFKRK